jgi:hypothetical protein
MKKYILEIEVDEEQLVKSYTGNDETINKKDLPNTQELLAFELNWLVSSGIEVKEITELKSN